MKWMRMNPMGPIFYVDEDCSVHGQVQDFIQHGGGGTNLFVGWQAYKNGKEIGRFTTERKAKRCVEQAYRLSA